MNNRDFSGRDHSVSLGGDVWRDIIIQHFEGSSQLTPEELEELVEKLKQNVSITGDGNVVGDNNNVIIIEQDAGDHTIQIGQLTLTLPEAASRHLLSYKAERRDFAPPTLSTPHHIDRNKLLENLISALTQPTEGRSSPVVALWGRGGVGKTTVARDIYKNADIRDTFSSILWAQLGRESDNSRVFQILRNWIKHLGGSIGLPDPTLDYLKARLAHLLQKGNFLLIVDDVWSKKQIRHFQVGGSNCRLLITTRRADIARSRGADIHQIDALSLADSIRLLEKWADGSMDDVSQHKKQTIVQRIDRLPLAIKLAGPQLRYKSPEALLESFDAYSLEDSDAEKPHDSLLKTFQLSLDDLSETQRAHYLALAVFPEGTSIPPTPISHLWEGLTKSDGDDSAEKNPLALLNYFADRALLQIDKSDNSIKLHNLVREIILGKFEDKERIVAHQNLLEGYRQSRQDEGWHTVPEDGYFGDHLIYHLTRAGWIDEIHGLFMSRGWTNKRERLKLLVEFEQAKDLITDETALSTVLRYTLFSDSLSQQFHKFPVEGLFSALRHGWINPDVLMTAIRGMEGSPEAKIRVYVKYVVRLPVELQGQFSDEILAIAQDMWASDDEERKARIELLKRLLPYLHGDAETEGQRTFWRWLFEISNSKAYMDWLLPKLSSKQLELLWKEVLNLSSEYKRIKFVDQISPGFDTESQHELWQQLVNKIDPYYWHGEGHFGVEFLAYLVPRLPKALQIQFEEQVWKVLDETRYWESKEFLAALRRLVPSVPAQYIPTLWKRAFSELKNEDRRWAKLYISAIALHLPAQNIPASFDILSLTPEGLSPHIKGYIELSALHRLPQLERSESGLHAWQKILESISKAYLIYDENLKLAISKLPKSTVFSVWCLTMDLDYEDSSRSVAGFRRRRFYHYKTLALIKLAKRLPKGQLAAVCESAKVSHIWEDLTYHDGSEWVGGWPQLIKTLMARFIDVCQPEESEIKKIWIDFLEWLLQDQNKYYSNIQESQALVGKMPISSRGLGQQKILQAIRDIPDHNLKTRKLAWFSRFAPDDLRVKRWLEAFGKALESADEYTLCSVLGCFKDIAPSENSRSILTQISPAKFVGSEVLNDIFELVQSQEERDPSHEGLALLISCIAKDIDKQFWINLSITEIESKILLLAVFPYVPASEQRMILEQVMSDRARSEKVNRIIAHWEKEAVWRAWKYVYDHWEPDDVTYWEYESWAQVLTPFLGEKDSTKAWSLALKYVYPVGSLKWSEIVIELSSQLPKWFLPQAWHRIEELTEENEFPSYPEQELKSAMASRLSADFLLALIKDNIKHPPVSKDIFTCPLHSYIQRGGPLFLEKGFHRMNSWEEVYDDYDFAVKKPDLHLKIVSYICYFTMPLVLLFTIQPLCVVANLAKSFGSFLSRMVRSVLWKMTGGFTRNIPRFLRNLMKPLIIIFGAGILLLQGTIAAFFLAFWLSTYLAKYYTMSKNAAISKLHSAKSAKEIVYLRPLLQRVGGEVLRKEVGDACENAWGWWRQKMEAIDYDVNDNSHVGD